ncbi:MAG TPA: J domain-containing protein [Rhodanobacteraceae bacterium]|nr:J domain-containing protein [Rhodanobacteraceae bacterium]
MAGGPTDFLRLYQELGLAPGASLDDLRRAYRRRVSELHPDRVGMSYSATMPGAAERLQQITALYGAATQFHRQHGRLPGSAAPPPRIVPNQGPPHETEPRPARGHARLAWFLMLIGLLIWFVWAPPWADNATDPDAVTDASTHATPNATLEVTEDDEDATQARAAAPVLRLGMSEDAVLAMQGEPVGRDQGRWDYGPSWISFDRKGNVDDWYSSALRPLKGATRHPASPAQAVEP